MTSTTSSWRSLGRSGPAPNAPELHAILGRQSEHLARLVDDLLDMARVSSGKIHLQPSPVDLAALVVGAVQGFRDEGRLAAHEAVVTTAPVTVQRDAARLQQVVANLVDKALKYTPAGGRIEVSAGPEGARP